MLVFRARHPRTRIVLLVEKLEPLGTVLQTILEKAEHLVLFAENSEKALRIAGTYVGSIDLLLTHTRLHGGSGPELASVLRSYQPEMAALYMSKSLIEMM